MNSTNLKNNTWQTKKLGDIFQIERGGSPRPIEKFLTTDENGINWIKIGDTKNMTKYIYKTEQKIKPSGLAKTRIVNEGDFILSNSMSFGRPYIMKITGAIHDGWLVLRKKLPNIDKNFFYYLLGSPIIFDQFDKLAAGSTVRNLNTKLVSNVSVLFPPISEQRRIVKILDGVFEKINKAKKNTEKNLQNSKELFESYLQNVFANPGKDWERQNLGNFLKLEYGKPLDKKDRNKNGKFPVYGANGEKNRTNKYFYNKPTIIIGRKGSAGELNFTENKFWPLDVTYFVVFDEKKYNLKFIYFLLSTLKLTRLAKGVKPGINRNNVYSIRVFTPSLNKQKSIVAKLDALSAETKKLEEIYKQKLSDLGELKKSILKKAFNGEL